MKKVGTAIFTGLSLFVFLALFLATGVLLYYKYIPHGESSRESMLDLQSKTRMWQLEMFDTAVYNDFIHERFLKDQRLLNVTIYSPREGILATFSHAAAPAGGYLKGFKPLPDWQPQVWKGKPTYQNLPFFGFRIYTSKVMIEPANDLQIAGVYQVLTYQEIFSVISYSFLIMIIWLVVSIIIRLFVTGELRAATDSSTYFFERSPDSPEATTTTDPGEGSFSSDTDEDEEEDENEEIEIPLSEDLQEPGEDDSTDPEQLTPPPVGFSQTTEEIPASGPNGGTGNVPPTGNTQARQPTQSENFRHVHKDPVCDLFSPRTGMGWQEHLLPRLKSEIKRTASFDQDMSFALISIDNREGLQDIENISCRLAKIILDLFLFQDLSFEYGRSSFAVILPDMGLEQAVREMEVLQRKVIGSRICEQFVTISIGLSSRNGRLISEDSLLKEAGKALELAIADKANNIVAFNPDPEKYREVISRRV